MSNTWTGNPLELDTSEDKDMGGLIQSIEYHPNAADNDVDLEDASGYTLFKCRAPVGAPNHEAEGIIEKVFNPPRNTTGFYLKTIDGGTLYIHLYRSRN
jgi:hypothetical protein